MKRLHTFLGLAALLVAGCGELGVGDPCAPQRPGGLPCPSPDGGTSGCFAGTEIYIETQSLACRSRICVVYKYSEETDPRGTDPVGYQRVYAAGERPIDVVAEVRTDDVVLVPHGWHGPAVAAPDADLYYLNVMAGPGAERVWLICDDPAHSWVRETWPTQGIDPRLT